jgi:dipeptide/tripeptide permease
MAEETKWSTAAIVRVVLLFMLLPAAFAFERMAYYGMRAMLFLHMSSDLGMRPADAGRVYSYTAIVGLFTVFLGGGLCVVLRPGIVLAAGAALGILAYGILAAADSAGGVWIAMSLLVLAQGLFKPAVLAHAARELPYPRFHLRAALFVALYAAINSAALTGASSGALAAARGSSASFVLSIVLASIGLVVALGTAGVDLFVKPNTPLESPLRAGRVALGGAVLIALMVPYHLSMGVGGALEMNVMRAASPSSYGMLQSLNPFVVMGTCALVLAACIALHLTRVRDLSLYGIGTGVAILAVAAAPLMIAAMSSGPPSDSTWLVGISVVGMAIGEAIAGPLVMCRVVGDIPPRFTGLAAAAWLSTSAGMAWIGSALSGAFPDGTKIIFSVSIVACLIVGIAVVALTGYLTRVFYEPEAGEA